MTKHKDIEFGQEMFASLHRIAGQAMPEKTKSRELRKMKKFRFQLLHRWLTEEFKPCRVADIAGGKGLLAYLLQRSGWESVVIDPIHQALPDKYKDITTGQRIHILPSERVPHINRGFVGSMAQEFDLLVGMHAHGCNVEIINIAAELGCGFVLFPCCVIDEPFYPRLGVHWLESLMDYAIQKGHRAYPFQLNFKGQNIGFYAAGRAEKLKI